MNVSPVLIIQEGTKVQCMVRYYNTQKTQILSPYSNIGVEGTSSSDLLTESLVEDIDQLKSDGNNVAVHGKWDGGIYGFPNIDRLGSCMWSDINKNMFPEHLKEVTICPDIALSDLTSFMKRSVKES
jgi:hypothetical protein